MAKRIKYNQLDGAKFEKKCTIRSYFSVYLNQIQLFKDYNYVAKRSKDKQLIRKNT